MGFYDGTKLLDELKKVQAPSSADLEKATKVIAGNAELTRYFYDKVSPGWLELLDGAKEFDGIGKEEAGVIEKYMADYLWQCADKKPEAVLEIIQRIKARDAWIQGKMLDAILAMPEDIAVKGISVVIEYLRERDYKVWHFVGEPAAKLMVKLVGKYPKAAFEIAWILLDAWLPKEKKLFEDIAAKFSEHDYQELILKYYAEVWKVEPERAFWVLVKLLNRCLEELDKQEGFDVSSHFYLSNSLQDLDTIDLGYARIETILVKGMCEAGKVLIQKQPAKVGELLDGLEKLKRAIFVRIEMYLLRFVGSGLERDRNSKIIRDMKYLEEPGYEYEYKLLLRDKFDEVRDARQVFEQRVQGWKIEDMEDWEEWFRRVRQREPSDEDKAKYVAVMKARELFLVKDRYPSEYEKYKTESGLSDAEFAPRRMVGEARAVSPMEGTPLEPEEMAKKKVNEVLDFILEPKNYEAKKKAGEWREPADALRATFKEDIKKRPIKYLKEGREKLANLPAEFLSGFFYGISEAVRDGSLGKEGWGDLIGFASLLVEERYEEQEYEDCFSEILSVLREGFGGGKGKLELEEPAAKKFWEILKRLIHFPVKNINDKSEERDPMQLMLRQVTGKALELTVLLGIGCKKRFPEYWEKELKLEMRECWEYVLGNIREPGVNCIFGIEFSRIRWLDEDWTKEKLDLIFRPGLWDETWGTYVSWGRPSRNGFKLLVEKGKYAQAVEKLGQANKYKFQKNSEEGLVEHFMIGFFNGWIGLDDNILKQFFETGSAELRGKSARFLTTGFKSVNEEGGEEKEKVAARMKEYWEKRLAAIKDKQEENKDEAIELTGWVEDSVLPAKETLELLEQSLDLSGGKIGKMRGVRNFVDGIRKLGTGNELLALRCLKKAAADENMHMPWANIQDPLVKFLETLVESPENIQSEAREVADLYGRYNPEKFRCVWEKLRKFESNNLR